MSRHGESLSSVTPDHNILLARKKERKHQTLKSLENNLFKNQSAQVRVKNRIL